MLAVYNCQVDPDGSVKKSSTRMPLTADNIFRWVSSKVSSKETLDLDQYGGILKEKAPPVPPPRSSKVSYLAYHE